MSYHQSLQRPSPGQEPPEGWVQLASWLCAEDSRAGEAAGVSSDGGVWVMCPLGSAAVPSSVAAGWVADVEEARVEPDRPRSGGRSCAQEGRESAPGQWRDGRNHR